MYDKKADQEAIKKLNKLVDETIIRLSMSNELTYAIWIDFYAYLRKYPTIFKFDVLSSAKKINSWLESSEKKWGKMMKKGLLVTLADYTYDDSRDMIEEILRSFKLNYKEATMSQYELLGWTQCMSFFVERAFMYYNITMKEMQEKYDSGLCNLFKCYDYSKCWSEMQRLYQGVWNRTRHDHTDKDVIIDHNNDRTKSCTYKLNQTITDSAWINERLRKAKMAYEYNMFGYRDLE